MWTEINEYDVSLPLFKDKDVVMCPMKNGARVKVEYDCQLSCPCCFELSSHDEDTSNEYVCGYAYQQLMHSNIVDVTKILTAINNNLVRSAEDLMEHLDVAYGIKHSGV